MDNDFAEAFLHLVFKPFHLEKEYYKLRQAEAIKLADPAIDKLQKLVYEFSLDENELQIVIDVLEILAEDKDKLVIKELNDFKNRLEIAKSLRL